MKRSVKELIAANCRNYGIMFLFLFGEILLLAVCQLGFHLDVMTSAVIVDLILCFITTALFFKFRNANVKGFEFKGSLTGKQIILYSLYFLVLTYCMNVLFVWFGNTFDDAGMASRADNISSSLRSVYLYLVISLFIAPMQEESMMRLWLYNLTKSRSHWMAAAVITSLTFGLMHGTTAHAIFATLFAILLTCIYEYTQVWYISILGHYIYNFATTLSGFAASLLSASAGSIPIVMACSIFLAASIIYFAVRVQKQRSGE